MQNMKLLDLSAFSTILVDKRVCKSAFISRRFSHNRSIYNHFKINVKNVAVTLGLLLLRYQEFILIRHNHCVYLTTSYFIA